MKDFDELRRVDVDRQFKLDGHVFHFHRSIDQDLVDAYFDSLGDEDTTNGGVTEQIDKLVLACLLPEDHEPWRKARHNTEDPVMGRTMHEIVAYMIGVMTGRPTEQPSASTGTQDQTGTSSTASSPQPEASPSSA